VKVAVGEGHSIKAWISSGIGKVVVTFPRGPEAASWACGNKKNQGKEKLKFIIKI
jgi:hypothetical protein